MPEMLILCGLPASGKTTYAREWVEEAPNARERVNYDDLRIEMYGRGWKFNREEENVMQRRALLDAAGFLAIGASVVVDNTNLTPGARQKWFHLADTYGIVPQIHEMPTPVWECVERDRMRSEGRVGRAVIERMALFTGWIDWEDTLRKFVIVDMDGTLSLSAPRAATYLHSGKKDWKGFFDHCHEDAPNPAILDLVLKLQDLYSVLVVSGRPIDLCGIKTENWLLSHGIDPLHLFMRQGGDHRADTIIKKEILDLLPLDRIAFCIDDRSSVVQMWREAGLTCLQCAPGEF